MPACVQRDRFDSFAPCVSAAAVLATAAVPRQCCSLGCYRSASGARRRMLRRWLRRSTSSRRRPSRRRCRFPIRSATPSLSTSASKGALGRSLHAWVAIAPVRAGRRLSNLLVCAQVAIDVVQEELQSPMHNELSQADQRTLQELNGAITEGMAAIGALATERAQVGSAGWLRNVPRRDAATGAALAAGDANEQSSVEFGVEFAQAPSGARGQAIAALACRGDRIRPPARISIA